MDRGDIRSRQTQSVVRSVCPIVKPKCVPAENEDLFVPFSDHRVRRNIPGFLERALATSRDKALVARRESNTAELLARCWVRGLAEKGRVRSAVKWDLIHFKFSFCSVFL